MDLLLLKKKISSYRTAKGRLTRVPDELAYELLLAWEEWTGTASSFYKEIGMDFRKVASLMGRAKKLKREGVFTEDQFREVKVVGGAPDTYQPSTSAVVVLRWGSSRILEFNQIDHVVEFFNKIESKSAPSLAPEIELQEEEAAA